MEEELDYKTVTFITNGVSVYEKPSNSDVIYDEVNTCDASAVLSGNKPRAPARARLRLLAVGLGVVCAVLMSTVIVLCISMNTAVAERERENMSLQRQNEELISERDGLNWTLEVVLEHEQFPARSYCPQNGACKPCLDEWIRFQSNCYLFSGGTFSSTWKTWKQSQSECKTFTADLLVIDSQEEQEFISNNTMYYHDERHGYWMGLKNQGDGWTWLEKQNLTVSYWRSEAGGVDSCALTLPDADPLANWQNTGCGMRNRWICERRALIRPVSHRPGPGS